MIYLRSDGTRAFRPSGSRVWCGDTGAPREAAEAALALLVRDKGRGAVCLKDAAGEAAEKTMAAWGDHIAEEAFRWRRNERPNC